MESRNLLLNTAESIANKIKHVDIDIGKEYKRSFEVFVNEKIPVVKYILVVNSSEIYFSANNIILFQINKCKEIVMKNETKCKGEYILGLSKIVRDINIAVQDIIDSNV